MKKFNLRVSSWTLAVALSAISVSCVKQPDPTIVEPSINPKEVFDFSVTKSHKLDITYDVPEGYRVGFDVYAENPFSIASDGSLIKNDKIKPLDKGFADDKGRYLHPIEVPTHVQKVYLHTQDVGVNPRFFVAKIENGVLTKAVPALYDGQEIVTTKSATTRAAISDNTKVGVEGMKFKKPHLLLSPWYQGTGTSGAGVYTTLQDGSGQVRMLGRPSQMSYADYSKFGTAAAPNDALKISAEVWNKISAALPGDNGAPVEEKFLADGNIHVSKNDTELDLIFIDQQALYNSTLAYYCYPTNQPPQNPDQIKYPVVAFANGMVQKFYPSLGNYGDIASLYKGEGVKLKYVDQNGQMHDKFPAGTSVGWILYRNGYGTSDFIFTNGIMAYAINEGLGANYASRALTENNKSNSAVLRVGDFVVIGMDDGDPKETRRDYLDLVFHVKATPASSIIDPIPDVDPEEPTKVIEKSGTLAFEDLWPSQGDFDMNDVVVTYNSKMTINKNNEITETEDSFSLYWCGASFKNGFSYTVDGLSSFSATVTFEGNKAANAKVDPKFGDLTVHLFENITYAQASSSEKPTIKVKTKFNTPISKDDLQSAPYNAYIRINDTKGSIGKETHLTNFKPINPDVAEWFGKSDDKSTPNLGLYFITFLKSDREQQLPFAIHIPNTGNPDVDKPFVIAKEGVRIDNYYPKFINWINTKGIEDTDWYLHPNNK